MPAPPAVLAPAAGVAGAPGGPLRVPQQAAHHLVVLVAQDPGQEQRGLVRAAGLEPAARPALPVDGHVPLALGAGAAPGPRGPRGPRLLRGVVAGRVRVVAQLVDPLDELTLPVEHLLEEQEEQEEQEEKEENRGSTHNLNGGHCRRSLHTGP